LGVQLPENFRLPYLAPTVSAYWRRWHISLYEWFREYVFQPLVRSLMNWRGLVSGRSSAAMASGFAIVVTMTLVGAWHGLRPSFILWGALNGILITLTPWVPLGRSWLGIVFTFLVTAVIRVLIVLDISGAVTVWRDLFIWRSKINDQCGQWPAMTILALAIVVPHLLDATLIHHREFWKKSGLMYILLFLLILFSITFARNGVPFLYTKF
jgi:hypothetical protein